MKIHQMLPNFSFGDAIGDDTLALQKILRKLGHESTIYAGVIHPYLVDHAKHWKQYRQVSHSDNVLIYHFSVGSEITEYLLDIPDRLVLIFHNITPAHWFYGFSPHMTELAADGLAQLRCLKDRAEAVWADSEFNAEQLRGIGFKHVRVLPIIIDFKRLSIPSNKIFAEQFRSSQATWIFTGRVSPNKCHQDIIQAFSVYKSHVNPHSRLLLVGDVRNCHKYAQTVMDLVRKQGISDVVFTGMIDDDEWAALFRMADLFVCMSEHEGYCVPLLEAMYFDVPIIAYDAGAVAGTLDGAGLLVKEKNPIAIAELADLVITDHEFKNQILSGQQNRLKSYRNTDFCGLVSKRLMDLNVCKSIN
jgi:L-malate glycosyltransferase